MKRYAVEIVPAVRKILKRLSQTDKARLRLLPFSGDLMSEKCHHIVVENVAKHFGDFTAVRIRAVTCVPVGRSFFTSDSKSLIFFVMSNGINRQHEFEFFD